MKTQIFALSLILAATSVNAQRQPRPPRPPRPPTPVTVTSRDYTDLSANEKLSMLWEECQKDQTMVPVPYAQFNNLFTQDPNDSFRQVRGGLDVLPEGRPKINHAQGVVGLIEWEDKGNHEYTGLYKQLESETALTGLLRLSEGNFLLPNAIGLTPSLAIKFPRDGMPSVNHLANVSFDPVEGWNFFAREFRSKVDLF